MNKAEKNQHKTLQTVIEEHNYGYICLLNCNDLFFISVGKIT